jgi:ketosteroid isomerase-like protein
MKRPANRLIAIAVAILVLPFLGLGVLVNVASAQQPDADAVKAAVYGVFAALSARDISKMEVLWVHDDNVAVLNVRDKTPSIGWDAGKKNWEAVIDFFSEVKAEPKEGPYIQINQGVASTTTVVAVQGKNKTGQPLSFTVLATQVYVKRGDRWLAVAHHASRAPD